MDWQLAAVAACVVAAGVYLTRRAFRTWFSQKNCGGGCCNSTPASAGPLIEAEELLARIRKK